jgi:ubiquitin-activating enzyme E1
MNPAFKSQDLQSLVAPVNEHIFNEQFWNDQTYIINAVDNIQARKYIDNQCTTYGKCLIDSGTLGTKAHVQMVVPHVTSCYNDSQDPPEEGVPLCTMHNFPAMIEHCIEWGRDHFNEYFTDVINDAKKLLENKDKFYSDLKKEGNTTLQLTKLKFIKEHVDLAAKQDIDKVIEFAVMQYTENFQYRIQQLLFNFPEDYTNKDGSKFWSGSKRVPHPIPYNAQDELAFLFVKNYSTILARALGIKGDLSDNHIKEVSAKVTIPPFVAKTVKIKVKDDEPEEQQNVPKNEQEIEEAELSKLMKDLSIYDKQNPNPNSLHPEDFEKDDDTNGHIDFIHACSNLRARNYKIQECDRQKTKMIAGKIIPAIATTTASITGIVSLQLYTLYQTNKIDFLRDCYMNLAINSIFMSEPKPAIHMKDKDNDPILLGPVKAIPPNWTVWDKITINKSMTVKELIDYIMEKYNVEVSIITSGSVTIIQTFMPSSKGKMNQKIEDVYNNSAKVKLGENDKVLNLEISGDIGDATALMPLFRYVFK